MQSPPGRERWLVGALLAGLLLFHWFTLRPGHGWGGDFAMYLAHAENLIQGEPYADTGYVVNPARPRLGPVQYPPGWPLLLAGPMAAFGVDLDHHAVEGLELLKLWLLLLFVAFLAVVHALARRRAGPTGAVGAVCVLLAVGLNPYLWDIKSALLSEIPFCLFLYAALLLIDRLSEGPAASPARAGRATPPRGLDLPSAGLALAAGTCLYLAYAMRTVALVAIPAVVLHDLVRNRRLRAATLLVLLVVGPAVLAQNQAFDVLSGYGAGVQAGVAAGTGAGPTAPGAGPAGGQLAALAGNALHNLPRMPLYLGWAWGGGLPQGVDPLLSLLLFAAAAVGFVAVVRERIGISEVFAVVYLGGLAVLPPSYVDLRRLVPLLPLFFLYVVRGLGTLGALGRPRLATAVRAGTALLLTAAYAGAYLQFERGPLTDGVHTPEARQLFEAVRDEVPADGLCLFFKPRVLALFADRPAAGFWESDPPELLIEQADQLGATHLIAGPGTEPEAPLRATARAFPARLEERWSNESFTLYRLRHD